MKMKSERKHRKRLWPSGLALLMLLLGGVGGGLASCGDYWEGGGDPLPARTMTLPRKVVNLLVGDRYQIPVVFNPESLPNDGVWWLSDDTDVARFEDGNVVGVSEGQAVVYATSAVDRLTDSCLVNVLPEAYLNPRNYPYDMVIYADVTIHGRKYTAEDEGSLIVAAYVDDELRGIGKMREWKGRTYMEIRIWSPFDFGDWVDLMCIYRGRALIELFPGQLEFDGMAHGTLSNLVPLVLDDDAEEYNFGYWFGDDDGDGDEQEVVPGDADD